MNSPRKPDDGLDRPGIPVLTRGEFIRVSDAEPVADRYESIGVDVSSLKSTIIFPRNIRSADSADQFVYEDSTYEIPSFCLDVGLDVSTPGPVLKTIKENNVGWILPVVEIAYKILETAAGINALRELVARIVQRGKRRTAKGESIYFRLMLAYGDRASKFVEFVGPPEKLGIVCDAVSSLTKAPETDASHVVVEHADRTLREPAPRDDLQTAGKQQSLNDRALDHQGNITVQTAEEAIDMSLELFATIRKQCNFTTDASLQLEARAFLDGQIARVEEARLRFRAAKDASSDANICLALKTLFSALQNELGAWLALKEGRFSVAWDRLISAENESHWAQGIDGRIDAMAEAYEDHLETLERVLFRKQKFISPTLLYEHESVRCSICDSPYGACEHISGIAYNGEFCGRVIEKLDVREISFVDEPADKRRRVIIAYGVDTFTGVIAVPDPNPSTAKRRRQKRKKLNAEPTADVT